VISQALSHHFIFTSLTEENRETVVQHMKYYTINAGDILFE